MVFGLLCLSLFNIFAYNTIAYPVELEGQTFLRSERGWTSFLSWGAESTVSVVDHSPVVSFDSRPAAFGADIDDPLLGYVIPLAAFTEQCHSESTQGDIPPNLGCPDLCIKGPQQPAEPWIALVQRGKCEFAQKVREAQRLGAKAVVVGGDDPAVSGHPDSLVNMYSQEDTTDITIPATYITYVDYLQLYSLITSSNTTHSGFQTLSLLITAEYSPWEWYSPIITFIIILLLPSVLTFITLLIHRIRAARAAQRERAPVDVVRNLPWQVWTGTHWEKHAGGEEIDSSSKDPSNADVEQGSTAKNVSEETSEPNDEETNDASSSLPNPLNPSINQPWFESQRECAICLAEFVKGDRVRVLPCHHIFHLDEVDEWLIQRKKLCPICKADVTQPSPTTATPPIQDTSVPSLEPTSPTDATERTPLLSNNNAPEQHPQ